MTLWRWLRDPRIRIPLLIVACFAFVIGFVVAAPQDPLPRQLPAASRRADFLPDPKLTPGQIDKRVKPGNIHSTICVAGYSRLRRPAVSVTNRLKAKVAKAYGIVPFDRTQFEGDHLIPISLGGNPERTEGTLNFWDEPWHYRYRGNDVGAKAKDGLEFYLYKKVCAGKIPLGQAQYEVSNNWYKAWLKYGKPKPPAFFGAIK